MKATTGCSTTARKPAAESSTTAQACTKAGGGGPHLQHLLQLLRGHVTLHTRDQPRPAGQGETRTVMVPQDLPCTAASAAQAEVRQRQRRCGSSSSRHGASAQACPSWGSRRHRNTAHAALEARQASRTWGRRRRAGRCKGSGPRAARRPACGARGQGARAGGGTWHECPATHQLQHCTWQAACHTHTHAPPASRPCTSPPKGVAAPQVAAPGQEVLRHKGHQRWVAQRAAAEGIRVLRAGAAHVLLRGWLGCRLVQPRAAAPRVRPGRPRAGGSRQAGTQGRRDCTCRSGPAHSAVGAHTAQLDGKQRASLRTAQPKAAHLVLRAVQVDEKELGLLVRAAGGLAPPALLPARRQLAVPLCGGRATQGWVWGGYAEVRLACLAPCGASLVGGVHGAGQVRPAAGRSQDDRRSRACRRAPSNSLPKASPHTCEGSGKVLGGARRRHLGARGRQAAQRARQSGKHAAGQHHARHGAHQRCAEARGAHRQPRAGGQQRKGRTQQRAQEREGRRQRAAGAAGVRPRHAPAAGGSTQLVGGVGAGRDVGRVRPPRAACLLCAHRGEGEAIRSCGAPSGGVCIGCGAHSGAA